MRNKLFGSREFYHRVLAISVPIMVQNAITNFVSLLDNVMIGRVGTVEMSGVAIANQLLFVFNMLVFGAIAGAGIFGAQFFGNRDMDGVRHTLRFKLMICLVLAAACIGIFTAFGPQLINLYLKGEGAVEDAEASLHYGLQYIKVMYIGMLPYAITQAYAGTLRETGETLLPMKAGIVAVLVNLTFNYILIFGHFGAPRMGVVGAAIATVLSRFVELAIVVSWAHRHAVRFPYITGKYGGAAFVLIYLVFLVLLGLPIMVMEFAVGRASQASVAMSFDRLEPLGTKWHWYKWFGMAGNYLLMMLRRSEDGFCCMYLRWQAVSLKERMQMRLQVSSEI